MYSDVHTPLIPGLHCPSSRKASATKRNRVTRQRKKEKEKKKIIEKTKLPFDNYHLPLI